MTSSQAKVDFRDKRIEMAHGAGGEATRRLVEGLFAPLFANSALAPLSDAALIDANRERLAVTTDSFVVKPLRFPGGSIGELAVNGTLNDLAVSGAKPIALTASFILEAGLDAVILRQEAEAMAAAAQRANVPVVAGDTKVVEHGKADGMYITTTGMGLLNPQANLKAERIQPGDHVILSGPIGAHGITIMIARAELELEADVMSDTRCLSPLVQGLIDQVGGQLKWMRDATRGGVATVLNELARDTGLVVELLEDSIPVNDTVRGACELLGLDPLHVANEGQFVAIVSESSARKAVNAVGSQARVVGELREGAVPRVVARTSYGGTRIVDTLIGDPLPRIC